MPGGTVNFDWASDDQEGKPQPDPPSGRPIRRFIRGIRGEYYQSPLRSSDGASKLTVLSGRFITPALLTSRSKSPCQLAANACMEEMSARYREFDLTERVLALEGELERERKAWSHELR